MALLRPVTFRDKKGHSWTAPFDATIDGASIPQVFWSIIGGPYEGKHRNASVVHDFECCIKREPWKDVHRMYLEAMLAQHEERWRALLMYWAVYWFGPRWPEENIYAGFTEDDIARILSYIEENPQLGPEDLEALNVESLRQRATIASDRVIARYGLIKGKPIPLADRPKPCFGGEFSASDT